MWMATPFRELRGGVGCLVVGPTGVGGWRSARGRHCDCGQSRGKTVWYSHGHGVFRGQARVSERVLAKPQYDEYRRLSKEMFQIMEAYTPTLVPMSIDEGFLDLTSMDRHAWRDTTVPTAVDYVNGLRDRIQTELRLPVSARAQGAARGWRSWRPARPSQALWRCRRIANRNFGRTPRERTLAGVGKRRERSLAALGALTFGDVARLPSTVMQQRFGIWGQQLWLFAIGRWNEPLLLGVKDRTTISSNTTLPYDEPDYTAALVFALSESTRMIGQLRREGCRHGS